MYSKPVVEEMSIKATAAGGRTCARHDGRIYDSVDANGNTIAVEEYYPASGEPNYVS